MNHFKNISEFSDSNLNETNEFLNITNEGNSNQLE